MNYKKRVKRTFDYERIKSEIENAKDGVLFGEWTYMNILWVPEIKFNGNVWSSYDHPLEKNYRVETMADWICCLEFYKHKGLFKKEFFGSVVCYCTERQELCEPVVEYFKTKATAQAQEGMRRFAFSTYEELEDFLNGLETVVNGCCDDYVYFDADEAKENAQIMKDAHLLVAYENELVELDHKMQMARETEERQRVELCGMVEDLKRKIADVNERLDGLRGTEEK